MTLQEGCSFCFEKVLPHFKQYGRDNLTHMVVAESDEWIARPDILPAQPQGLHFVMRPKKHSINYLEGDPNELGRFLYGIEKRFGPFAIMKHGDVKEETSSVMSIRHDHSHLFPNVDINVVDYIRDVVDRQGIEHRIIETPDPSYLVHLKKEFQGHPYMYVQHGGVGLFVNDEHERLGTQQIQRAMQRHYNGTTFNWKEIESNPEYAQQSVTRLSNFFENYGTIEMPVLQNRKIR